LWHQLMGTGVLSVDISGSSYLRAYVHCAKQKASLPTLRCFFFQKHNVDYSTIANTRLTIQNIYSNHSAQLQLFQHFSLA
jgi:hypothetical protein